MAKASHSRSTERRVTNAKQERERWLWSDALALLARLTQRDRDRNAVERGWQEWAHAAPPAPLPPSKKTLDSTDRGALSHARFSSLGVAAEHAAIAKLLDRGHKVAVPVVDDHEVDLIVDYHFLVQVKSTVARPKSVSSAAGTNYSYLERQVKLSKNRSGEGLPGHIDFWLICDRDTDDWWVIPRRAFSTIRQLRNTISISLGARHDQYRGAWHLLLEKPGPKLSLTLGQPLSENFQLGDRCDIFLASSNRRSSAGYRIASISDDRLTVELEP